MVSIFVTAIFVVLGIIAIVIDSWSKGIIIVILSLIFYKLTEILEELKNH